VAFLDDRVWCHPKWAALSPDAAWIGIRAICYAHGFRTRGTLNETALRMIGATDVTTDELVTVGLWERNGAGNAVAIHDWADYNDDERLDRQRDLTRDRVRRHRARNADDALPVTPGNADVTDVGNAGNARYIGVTSRARANESESDSDLKEPPTPAQRGLRDGKKNPRALGTNPRAVSIDDRTKRHRALVTAAATASDEWEQTGTDEVHERLDALERFHGSRLDDQERARVIDHYLNRWR
jgi:hypothetical protein